jgi:hypothetical protein
VVDRPIGSPLSAAQTPVDRMFAVVMLVFRD